MREPVRLLIIDDHPVVAHGVTRLLEFTPIVIVGNARSVWQALPLIDTQQPDVALLDPTQPESTTTGTGSYGSFGAVRALREAAAHMGVLLFSASPNHPGVGAAMSAGAAGWLGKNSGRESLCGAISTAASVTPAATSVAERTRVAAAPSTPGRIPAAAGSVAGGSVAAARPPITADLTLRQQQILRAVAAGNTNHEIAKNLNLSPNTIKTYWQQTLHKLAARNRGEAVSTAYRLGLL